jgi:hypothetical protein
VLQRGYINVRNHHAQRVEQVEPQLLRRVSRIFANAKLMSGIDRPVSEDWAGRTAPPRRSSGLVLDAESAKLRAMRRILACFCLAASPGWAWEFTPEPVCTLFRNSEASSVIVTYDPQAGEYAITLRRAAPWPLEPIFAIRFDWPRGLTISTSRHRLSEGGTALTVTDRGFGNVLDGLQYNEAATALAGSASLSVSLDGAAPAVQAFRDCAQAQSV